MTTKRGRPYKNPHLVPQGLADLIRNLERGNKSLKALDEAAYKLAMRVLQSNFYAEVRGEVDDVLALTVNSERRTE